jgi:hypothetical protein
MLWLKADYFSCLINRSELNVVIMLGIFFSEAYEPWAFSAAFSSFKLHRIGLLSELIEGGCIALTMSLHTMFPGLGNFALDYFTKML